MAVTQARTSPYDRVATVIEGAVPLMICCLSVMLIWIGWLNREEEFVTPKEGAGYWLGWIGGVLMLLMFLYSYRKRARSARSWGSIPAWFRIHMIAGVLAPILILYHANFRLGALNSNVALFTMLAVVASGIIGRYIHGKVYASFSERKAVAKKSLAKVAEMRHRLEQPHEAFDDLVTELNAFGVAAIKRAPDGVLSGIWIGGEMWVKSYLLRIRMRRKIAFLSLKRHGSDSRRVRENERQWTEVEKRMEYYVDATLSAVEARVFERLFALWHVFHFPMVFVMVLAGVVHVWAVHRY